MRGRALPLRRMRRVWMGGVSPAHGALLQTERKLRCFRCATAAPAMVWRCHNQAALTPARPLWGGVADRLWHHARCPASRHLQAAGATCVAAPGRSEGRLRLACAHGLAPGAAHWAGFLESPGAASRRDNVRMPSCSRLVADSPWVGLSRRSRMRWQPRSQRAPRGLGTGTARATNLQTRSPAFAGVKAALAIESILAWGAGKAFRGVASG